jgi:hypothetical protein
MTIVIKRPRDEENVLRLAVTKVFKLFQDKPSAIAITPPIPIIASTYTRHCEHSEAIQSNF